MSIFVYDFASLKAENAGPIEFAAMEYKSGTPITFCVFQNKMEILTNEKNKEYGAQLILSRADHERLSKFVTSLVDTAKYQLTGGSDLVESKMHPVFKTGRYQTIRVKVPRPKLMKLQEQGNPRDSLFEAEQGDFEYDENKPCIVVVQLTGIWRKNIKMDESKKEDNEKMWGVSFRAIRVISGVNTWFDAPSFRSRVLDATISSRYDPEGKEISIIKLAPYDKNKRKATPLSDEEKQKRDEAKKQKAERRKSAKEIEAPKL